MRKAKCQFLLSLQTVGEVDTQIRQVCSHILGLDSEILPGRSDPSAKSSRTRSGESIPAKGVARAKTLKCEEEQCVQGIEVRQILNGLLDPSPSSLLPSVNLE